MAEVKKQIVGVAVVRCEEVSFLLFNTSHIFLLASASAAGLQPAELILWMTDVCLFVVKLLATFPTVFV